MARGNAVYVCGGDTRPGPREACLNTLHDWPLPSGYVDAHEAAGSRLYRRWKSVQCPDCQRYGWLPGTVTTNDTKVPHIPTEPETGASHV